MAGYEKRVKEVSKRPKNKKHHVPRVHEEELSQINDQIEEADQLERRKGNSPASLIDRLLKMVVELDPRAYVCKFQTKIGSETRARARFFDGLVVQKNGHNDPVLFVPVIPAVEDGCEISFKVIGPQGPTARIVFDGMEWGVTRASGFGDLSKLDIARVASLLSL